MPDIKVKVFFSYSHEDEALRDELAKHLKPLERQGKIETWHDRKIDPGTDWKQELDSQLNSADIILLLVSSSFVASDFCYCTELEQARKRHDAKESRIIPIFLRFIDLDALDGSPLQMLQGLPDSSKPVSQWDDIDEAFTIVAKGVRKIVEEIYQEKENYQAVQLQENSQYPSKKNVPKEHYIERDEATKMLGKFSTALKIPCKEPLLFNVYGIGGVGKTTLLEKIQEIHTEKVDFLRVCFAKTPSIETPLKLMRKFRQQAIDLWGSTIANDPFLSQDRLFEDTLFVLSHRSIDGGVVSSEEAKNIRNWFERSVWLGLAGLISMNKPTSFNVSGLSALATVEEEAESLQEWIEQLVRNHPETKDYPERQALMLEPVSKLTRAFAESLIQLSEHRVRPLVLILDTYEKVQSYLNQWLWQYLVEDTILSSSSVRIVVVGRKSLQADEGWRKLNQDRSLLYIVQLKKFERKDNDKYLQSIGIENGGMQAKIFNSTQGLPYSLNRIREQQEKGIEFDFIQGNQAITELLLQGQNSGQRKILQVVACCRWFDLAIIRYLFNKSGLDQYFDNAESCFEWLKNSGLVDFSKSHYCLDTVARDVFRQSYFHDDQNCFRQTNAALADYFNQQADKLIPSPIHLPEKYEDEDWRILSSEALYYGLFGQGREGLYKYIEQVFTTVFLNVQDMFINTFSFISSEISEENQSLLPNTTYKFFEDSKIILGLGGFFLGIPPENYEITNEEESNISQKMIEDSLSALLAYTGKLQDGFGKFVSLIYKSLRSNNFGERNDLIIEAKKQFEAILSDCNKELSDVLLSSICSLLTILKRYEDLLDCYEKSLDLGGDNASNLVGKSFALFGLKRYEEVLTVSQNIIDIDPKNINAWINKSAAHINLEQYDKALESSRKALNIDSDSVYALVNKASALLNLYRYKEALSDAQKAIALNPMSANAWVNQGSALSGLRQYDEALKSSLKAIELDPESIEALMLEGSALFGLKRYKESSESYQKAVDLDSKIANNYVVRFSLLLDLYQYEDALKSANEKIEFNVTSVKSWVTRSSALFGLKRYEEAIENASKAIELNPTSPEALLSFGKILVDLHRYEEALENAKKIIELIPESIDALLIEEKAFVGLQRYEDALESSRKLIDSNPEIADFWLRRGNILLSLGRYEESLESSQRAININPKSVNAWLNRSNVFNNLERHEEAFECSLKAIEIEPGSIDAHLEKSRALINIEKYEEVLVNCQELLIVEPKSYEILNDQGIALLCLRRYHEALDSFNTALEISLDDIFILNCKSLVLSLIGKKDESISLINRVLEISPNQAFFIANHGIILARNNRYTEAFDSCELAINQSPENEIGYYGKACCYAHKGDIQQTLDNLQKAINIKPRLCRREARCNPDFDIIRKDARFQALIYPQM